MTDWQQALTAQIARNIEYHRLARGLKRVDLATRCTELGLPTKRPALVALLDGHRQTITIQELVVLADALEVSVAELFLPLHAGGIAVTGPAEAEEVIDAAARLFAIEIGRTAAQNPYRPFLRYRRAAAQFERANRHLAELSHRIATGAQAASLTDGRPHPASEILAAEAALSRLLDAKHDLNARALIPPALGDQWDWIHNEAPSLLPVLDLLPEQGRGLLPMLQYRLHPNHLPSALPITER